MSIMKRKACVALFAISMVIGGGVAAADAPVRQSAGQTYSCAGLTSAKVPEVQRILKAADIDPAEAKGPIGVLCKTEEERAAQEEIEVGLDGIDGAAYTCGKAEEKKGKTIILFNECKA
ncbi:hypothetical protein ACQPZF_22505 [Actinosynnema sp. CS-041913]|uniref:hypothetical protein n=1 Tax=Actinosynnema sp. CS-041913 TaxID=3239917 RepID=UPI003D8FD63C